MSTITPSALRADLYRLLDQVLETGEALEILRHGRVLRITADDAPSRLSRLPRRPDLILGDPGDLVGISFADDWTGAEDPDA